jgi:hypothetical protein
MSRPCVYNNESYLNTEAKGEKLKSILLEMCYYTISWLQKQRPALSQVSDSTNTSSVWNFMTQSVHSNLLDCAAQ